MLPHLAALVCIAFIVYLFWIDSKKSGTHSTTIWLPFLWMFLAGSRYVSSWLDLRPPMGSATALSEGSPVDRAAFLLLIVAGVIVLSRRKIDWGRFLSQNQWVVLYYLYCLSSIAWADEPFVLFKRWIKDLGNPVMALIILTEQHPYEVFGVVLKRLAFLLLPLSVLFIKYYPDLGRAYHFDGSPMYTGVGSQKNDLGALCLISGIYFSWEFLQNRKGNFQWREKGNLMNYLLIGMIAWLLHMSNSQTSLVCLVVATSLFVATRIPFIEQRPSRLIAVMIFGVLLFSILETTLHVKELILNLLGRDSTLTNRTEIWAVLATLEGNPFVGVGFMSFWSGDRLEKIWEAMDSPGLNQAHNGYLEQYLNLGFIGLILIIIIILWGLIRVRKHLDVDPPGAMLRLCCIVTAVLYNYTEASFYGLNNIWLLLLIGIIEISGQYETKRSENGDINKHGKLLSFPDSPFYKSFAQKPF